MNQYEIELRDKFAAIAMEHHFKACINDRNLAPLSPNHLAEMVYNFASALMAERQKHLDKAEAVNSQTTGARSGWNPIDWDVINAQKADDDAKVQGTECDR